MLSSKVELSPGAEGWLKKAEEALAKI